MNSATTVRRYKDKVLRRYRGRKVVMLGKFYQWFWFHTEFWLTHVDRRPYTFIMRDWMYNHTTFSAALVILFYIGMIVLSLWHGTITAVISALGSFILAHLVWGSKWIEGQQEFPEYIDTDNPVMS